MLVSNRFCLEITPGFLLLLAASFWIDREVGIMPQVLVACAVHEVGHILAAAAFGGRAVRLRLTSVGAELAFHYQTLQAYWKDIVVALAGPAANGLAGLIFATGFGLLPALINFGVGLFNLLPAFPLDGGCVLQRALHNWLEPPWPDRIIDCIAGVVAGIMLGFGVVAMIVSANMTLFLTSFWLLTKIVKK